MQSIDEHSEDCYSYRDAPRKISSDSLASSYRSSNVSLISQGSLQRLIKEVDEDPETNNNPSEEIMVISFHQEIRNNKLGIILTGGSDYENKDVTVYRILPGTIADLDGRIRVGDKILSINGKTTQNLTLAKAVKLLKVHRTWVILVVSRDISEKLAKGWDLIKKCNISPFNIYSSSLQTILENSFGSKDIVRPSSVRRISRTKTLDSIKPLMRLSQTPNPLMNDARTEKDSIISFR